MSKIILMPKLRPTKEAVVSAGSGALLLDVVCPDWLSRIDPERLDLSDQTFCILGHVFGNYYAGCEWLAIEADSQEAAEMGFYALDCDYEDLELAWCDELEQRYAISSNVKPEEMKLAEVAQ